MTIREKLQLIHAGILAVLKKNAPLLKAEDAKKIPMWQGKMILHPDHAEDLERAAAYNEFGKKMGRTQAEDEAHDGRRVALMGIALSALPSVILLLLPSAGDELQGIKKGIVELAELMIAEVGAPGPAENVI